MAFRTVGVRLIADPSQLRSGLLIASNEVQAFDRRVSAASSNVSKQAQIMQVAVAAGGVAVAAGFAYSIKSAVDFETAMRNVNSISHLSEEAFRAQGDAVLGLSKELPQSAQVLAEGLYQIASSGFQGADGLKVLEESAKAASAGLTTTDNAAQAITAVLNAYGRQAGDAADVSDVLFQTVNLGVVSFEQLTGVIGDTVGTAAAAGVGIDQVGAAIATMTLSGISAEESGTSLNRTLQSIIKPSAELSTVLHAVGYESGAQALQADGLKGVMDKLRGAVGSNVEAWLQLFPEIRAARGALALTAAEGKNYQRVSDEITDANKRHGATQKALDEQLKATGAQFEIFLNRLNAWAITGATNALPFVRDLIAGLNDLGSAAIPKIQAGLDALAPFFTGLAQVGGDAATVVDHLASALGPLAGALATIAAGAAIGALNGLATALAAITGFLADHPALVEALAIAYGASLVPALAANVLWFGRMAATIPVLALEKMAEAGGAGSLAMSGLGAAMAALPLVAVAALFVGVSEDIRKSELAAKQLGDQLRQGLDLKTPEGLAEFQRRIAEAQPGVDSLTKSTDGLRGAFLDFATHGRNAASATRKQTEEQKALTAAQEEAARRSIAYGENVATIQHATGRTTEEIKHMAAALGVDLTEAYGKSGPAREKIITDWQGMAREALGGGEGMKQAATLSIEELQRLQSELEDTAKKVGEAFQKSTDIVSNFKAGADLGEFLTKNLADANTFVSQIQEAARRGLDPTLIKNLLEAGPAQAAPFLAGVLSDHSGRLIGLANETQAKLNEVNAQVVEMARVTQRAVNTSSTAMASDFGLAMDIMAAKAQLGGHATVDQLAAALGVGVGEVQRVTNEYVIITDQTLTGPLPATAGAAGANAAGSLVDQFGSRTGDAANRAEGYVQAIIDPLNWILNAIGASPVNSRGTFSHEEAAATFTGEHFAQGGARLPRDARLQPPGTLVQWAEPETQGEYFIPRANDGRRPRAVGVLAQAADDFGYQMVRKFATGGWILPSDIPTPPDFSDLGTGVGYTGDRVDHHLYDAVIAFVQAHPQALGGGSGGSGYGYQALIDFINSKGIDNTVTSTVRPGSITTNGNLSEHAGGWAADFAGDMDAITAAFNSIGGSMRELIHDPGGSIKGGQPVDPSFWGAQTWAEHANHVHAATFHGPDDGPGIPTAADALRGAAGGGSAREIGRRMAAARGWGGDAEWNAIDQIFTHESGWDPNSVNPSSGAYGIPQANPSGGQGHPYALGDVEGQIAWGLNYIADRYGDPLAAWDFWQAHNWYAQGGLHTGTYDVGGWLMPGTTIATNNTGRPERISPPGPVQQRLHADDIKAIGREMAMAMTSVTVEVGAGDVSRALHERGKRLR